MSPEGCNAS
ncbi:non-ribosomal peptide synthetase [Pseudomonas aeruginosa]|nr:non-ribosomal peptide synthetase [Pseudomonas aeruginosa]